MVISEGVGRGVLPTSPPERAHLAYLECQDSARQPHWNLPFTTPKGLERWAETLKRWSKYHMGISRHELVGCKREGGTREGTRDEGPTPGGRVD